MRALFFALGIAALVGCTSIRPVGPLAKFAAPAPKPASAAPQADSAAPPAVRPTPPTLLVSPNDVSAETAREAAEKLTTELGADSKSPVNGPVTVEVSRVKAGTY